MHWDGSKSSAEPLKEGRGINTKLYIYISPAIAKQQGIRQGKLSADSAKWFPIN